MGKSRTANLEKVVRDARGRIERIRRDADLTGEAKQRRVAEAVRDSGIEEALDEIQVGYDEDVAALRRRAARPDGGGEKLDLILREIRLDRLERRFSGEIARAGGPSAERYRDVLDGGDPLEVEAYEAAAEVSGAALPYGLRDAISASREDRRLAGMTDVQRGAEQEARP